MNYPYLEPGKENPTLMIEGQKREHQKSRRTGEAEERYLIGLKQKIEKDAQKKAPKVKQPKILETQFPVSNPQSPVIQDRE